MENIKIRESVIFDTQRKGVAHLTASSWRNVPHVSYIYEPDITNFYNEYISLSKERLNLGYKITFNTLMIKLVVEGLLKAPKLNSHVKYNHISSNGILQIFDEINVAMPWIGPDGRLINPNVLDAGKKSLNEIADRIAEIYKKLEKTNIDELLYMAAAQDTIYELKNFNLNALWRVFPSEFTKYKSKRLKGKERRDYYNIPTSEKLVAKDITSGTVTVSNIGTLAKDQSGYFGLLDIIAPQSFIVGVSSIMDKPSVFIDENKDKKIGIRKILPLCLVFDHRAFDLDAIIPFVKRLDEIFLNPKVIHNW